MEQKLVYGALGFLLALLIFFAGRPQALHLTVAGLGFLVAFLLLFAEVAEVPLTFTAVSLAFLASLLVVLTSEGRIKAFLKLAFLIVVLFAAFRVLFEGIRNDPAVFAIAALAFVVSLIAVLGAEGRIQAGQQGRPFGGAFKEMLQRDRSLLQGTFGDSLFDAADYVPFMVGMFVAGGLLVVPLLWGSSVGLGYFGVVPWSLGACIVFFVAFRRDGAISWLRCALVVVVVGVWVALLNYLAAETTPVFGAWVRLQNYVASEGNPALSVAGMLAVFVVFACGYVGIGVGRMIR